MARRACFCLSKGRPAVEDGRRLELGALKLTELRVQAKAAGATDAAIDAALDSESKDAMVELVVHHERAGPNAGLRAELAAKSMSALLLRAQADGVTEASLDAADDADNPRQAVIDLIVLREDLNVVVEEDPAAAGLRAELAQLKRGALIRRALAAGVAQGAVDEAEEQDDTDGAIIDLIVAVQLPPTQSTTVQPELEPQPEPRTKPHMQPEVVDSLQHELHGLKLSALKRRAKTAGISDDQLGEADDSGDAKNAVIALIVGTKSAELDAQAALIAGLEEMRVSQLKKRASVDGVSMVAIDAADDEDDPKAAVIQLILDQSSAILEQRSGGAQSGQVEPTRSSTVDKVGANASKPHHGRQLSGSKSLSLASNSFAFLEGKHCMFSYQWDAQEEVLAVREHFAKLGIPTWMDIDGGMLVDMYDSMARGVSNAACVVAFMSQRYQDSQNCKLELQYAQQRNIPIVPVMITAKWRPSEWLGLLTAGKLWTPLHDQSQLQDNLAGLIQQIKASAPSAIVPSNAFGATDNASVSVPAVHAVVATSSAQPDTQELRSEIETLRQTMLKKESQRAREDAHSTSSTASQALLALVPGEVPPLSLSLQPTKDMKMLKTMLLSSTNDDDSSVMAVSAERAKIGALGMGGIGKTVTASWLARDDDVRRHFDAILWCTLGQTPDLVRTAALLYLQLTGEEVAPDSTVEQCRELLIRECRGKSVLFCLDDLWETSHETHLSFLDSSTSSKTLITTRIRGLAGATNIELGVPSEAAAVALLLGSAGLAHLSPAPADAAEVVQICGRLPLSCDLAGKLLKDLGVSDSDWTGVPKLLRQQMRAQADGQDEDSIEYKVIRTSLNAIPFKDRENARLTFSVFALVAEDVHVPLRAVTVLLSAITGDRELVPELQVRYWLQVLINRSLIIGTWERPQLHDIVREYVIGLFEPAEMKRLQRKVVDCFCAHRPISNEEKLIGLPVLVGSLGASGGQNHDEYAQYVLEQIRHHLAEALLDEIGEEVPECCYTWISHYPGSELDPKMTSDAIIMASAEVLGKERLKMLCVQARQKENWWLAYCAFCAYGIRMFLTGGFSEMFIEAKHNDILEIWVTAQHKCIEQRPSQLTQKQHELLELNLRMNHITWRQLYPTEKELTTLFPFFLRIPLLDDRDRIIYLLENTEAGRSNPMDVQEFKARTEIERLLSAGNLTAADKHTLAWLTNKLRSLLQPRDSVMTEDVTLIRRLMLALTGLSNDPEIGNICSQGTALLRLQGDEQCAWPWDLIDRALSDEQMFSHHFNSDSLTETGLGAPLALVAAVRGDLEVAHRGMDTHIEAVRGCNDVQTDEKDWCQFYITWSLAAGYLPSALRTLGRSDEAASLLAELGHSWHTTDELVDSLDSGVGLPWKAGIRPRGRLDNAGGVEWCVEDISWTIKLQQILCTWNQVGGRGTSPSVAEIAAALPAVDELASFTTNCSLKPGMTWRGREGFGSVLLLAAEVCEQIGNPAQALTYITRTLRSSSSSNGDSGCDLRPTVHTQGHALHGRVLASMDRLDEAEAAFEEAVDIAHRTGLRLYEMFAIRDLKVHVLDKRGRSAEGMRRLKCVLAEMIGPPTQLTRLLGEGLDAEQILAS